MEPPIRQLTNLLKRGVKQGLLIDLDPIVGVALLLGPMILRRIFPSAGKGLPENLEKLVVDAFWRAHVNPEKSSKHLKRSSSNRSA
jgi:hypothetical protein